MRTSTRLCSALRPLLTPNLVFCTNSAFALSRFVKCSIAAAQRAQTLLDAEEVFQHHLGLRAHDVRQLLTRGRGLGDDLQRVNFNEVLPALRAHAPLDLDALADKFEPVLARPLVLPVFE